MTSGDLEAALARFRRTIRAPGGNLGYIRVAIEDDSAERKRGLDRMFDAMGAVVDDFPQILEAAVPTIKAAHAAVFATQGTAGRGRWAPLAPRTLAERHRLGYGPGPILKRTGALEAHVLATPAKITRRGMDVELRIEPDRMVDGVPKYRALAKGYAPGNLPGRPIVAIGPAAARKVTSTIQRALRARARAAGLG